MELTRTDGTVIYWTTEGEGPPIVLSHGLFANHRTFDLLAHALVAAGRRVIRWDARGHGRSTRGPGDTRFTDLVDDLFAVIDAAAAEQPILIGHDLGGTLTLAAALARPGAFPALSVWATDPGPAPASDRVAAAVAAAARHVAMRPFTIAMEPLWLRRGSPDTDDALAVLHRRNATTMSAAALAEIVQAYSGRPDLRPSAREIDVSVQVLWGEWDLLLRPNAGREILAILPRAEGGPIPDAAHLIHIDRPEIVEGLVLGWLGRIGAPAT